MALALTLSVSSVTGNTARVADAVRRAAEDMGWAVHDMSPSGVPDDEVVIVCFWCRKSSLDPLSKELVERCRGKRILAFGTFGGFPSGKYADTVRANVANLISEHNECLGVFLCQGKVKMTRIEHRRALPPTDPHHLDDWGMERLMEGRRHPDEADLAYARGFTRDYLAPLTSRDRI